MRGGISRPEGCFRQKFQNGTHRFRNGRGHPKAARTHSAEAQWCQGANTQRHKGTKVQSNRGSSR